MRASLRPAKERRSTNRGCSIIPQYANAAHAETKIPPVALVLSGQPIRFFNHSRSCVFTSCLVLEENLMHRTLHLQARHILRRLPVPVGHNAIPLYTKPVAVSVLLVRGVEGKRLDPRRHRLSLITSMNQYIVNPYYHSIMPIDHVNRSYQSIMSIDHEITKGVS